MPQLLHAADKPKERISYDRLDSCTERDTTHGAGGAGGSSGCAQLTTSKQRLVEEEEAEDSAAESGADADGMGGSGGGGGGGGGRVGTLPSFPRSFSAGTAKAAAVNKKFAWVP